MPVVRTVYIVGASPLLRRSIVRTVRGTRFLTQAFTCAADLLDAAAYIDPGCAIVDMALPDGPPLEVLRLLSEKRPDMPIVMTAECASVETAVRMLRGGAADFLARPFQDSALLEMLDHLFLGIEERVRRQQRVDSASGRVALLTSREREVLRLVLAGFANKAIADTLALSQRTVEAHRANVMAKLGATSLPQLTRIAIIAGIIPLYADDEAA